MDQNMGNQLASMTIVPDLKEVAGLFRKGYELHTDNW